MASHGHSEKPPGAEMRYLRREDPNAAAESDMEQHSPMIGALSEYDRV